MYISLKRDNALFLEIPADFKEILTCIHETCLLFCLEVEEKEDEKT